MTISSELLRLFEPNFRVLILDNEVTLDAFVTDPPLPWARLVATGGAYRIADDYPTALTMAEADREEMNWDKVSDITITTDLQNLAESVDLIAFGNNATQGFPLANALPAALRDRGVIIYGRSLPEQPAYEQIGYSQFCARTDLLSIIEAKASAAGRPAALAFINTIEHNDQNYHVPWNG
jgi:hypothetical protein